MTPPKKPETTIRIDSESSFREKVWLSGSPIALEWKKDQVIDTTEWALSKLRDELGGKQSADEKRQAAEAFIQAQEKAEKKDAIDKLTDKLGDSLLKNPAVLATAGAAATGVGAVVVGLDKKAKEITGEDLGFMDGIRDWLKDAIKNSESGFMKWLYSLLYKAFKFFGDEEADKPNPAKPPKPAAEKPRESIVDESIIKGTAALLAKVSPILLRKSESYKDQKNISTILTMPDILKSNYGDLQSKFQKYSPSKIDGIAKEFWAGSYKDKEVYDALFLLFADEKLFASLFAPEKGDTSWKKKPVSELFQLMSSDIKIFERMEKAASAASIGEFDKLFGAEDESEGIVFQGWAFIGDMKEKVEAMMSRYKDKGLTMKVASDLMLKPGELTRETMLKRWYDEKEISFVEYMKTYSQTVVSLISSDSYGGSSVGNADFFKKKPLSLNESFRFFLFSGDAKTLGEMSVFAQYKSYGFVRKAINVRNDNNQLAKYDTFLLEESKNVVKWKTSKIPEPVQNILRSSIDGIKNVADKWLSDNFSYAWELWKKNPEFFIIAIGMVSILWMMWRVAFASKVAVWTVALTLATIAWLSGYSQIESAFKKEQPKA
jgi:hypothetical protein